MCKVGRLYTWVGVNTNKERNYKHKEMRHCLVSNRTKGGMAIKKDVGTKVSINESKVRKSGHKSSVIGNKIVTLPPCQGVKTATSPQYPSSSPPS